MLDGVNIQPGPGTPLGDIALLLKRFEKVSNEDARTKMLFALAFPDFNGVAADRSAKRLLRHFSGWATQELRNEAHERLMSDWLGDVELLRKTCRLLDLSSEGDPETMAARLEDYLASPSVIVHAPKEEVLDPAAGKKKRKAPGGDRKDKNKRPPNAYQLFAAEKREEVTKSQPDLMVSRAASR